MFSLFLIGHAVSDFLLQSKKVINEKWEMKLVGYLKHVGIHGLVYLLLLLLTMDNPIQYWNVLLTSWVVLVGTHFCIDYVKGMILKDNGSSKAKLFMFILDQTLHIVVIFYVFRVLYGANLFDEGILTVNTLWINYAKYLLYIPLAGAVVVRYIVESLGDEHSSYSKYIGVFERLIIVGLFILNSFEGIIFVLALKAVMALAESKNDGNKSRVIILETLSSVAFAVVVFIILNLIGM